MYLPILGRFCNGGHLEFKIRTKIAAQYLLRQYNVVDHSEKKFIPLVSRYVEFMLIN